MVEGDLVDLTLPSLLHALSSEGSTAVLRLQRGSEQGALYFSEGALVHARAGGMSGDQAVRLLLQWPEGRFRLVREADAQPRTISQPVADFLTPAAAGGAQTPSGPSNPAGEPVGDERLLAELLALLTRLEQDRARLAEGRVERGVPTLLVVTAVVNSVIAYVTARCRDSSVLPSQVLARLAETDPYTQLLGEEQDRITVATAAAVLKAWNGGADDQHRMVQDLCRALTDVLVIYGQTITTFFHHSREREEWRATFAVFVDDLRAAAQQGRESEPTVNSKGVGHGQESARRR